MKNLFVILLFSLFFSVSASDFTNKWLAFENATKAQFQAFQDNVTNSTKNFETSVNSKLDAWATNHKRAIADFEARTENKLTSTFTNMCKDLDAFESNIKSHLDSTFDKSQFDSFQSSINSKFASTFDETRENFKDMKTSLKAELGEDTYNSSVASDVDGLQSSLDTDGHTLQAVDGIKSLLDEAADEAETEAAENTPAEEEEDPDAPPIGTEITDPYEILAKGIHVVQSGGTAYGWTYWAGGGGEGACLINGWYENVVHMVRFPPGWQIMSYSPHNLGPDTLIGDGKTSIGLDSSDAEASASRIFIYGIKYVGKDSDGDGVPDDLQDTDGDGIPDKDDPDADGDGVDDAHEDSDGNGVPDDEEMDSPDTTVDFSTGIPALDKLIAKLTPKFDFSPNSRSEYSFDVPIETSVGDFTMSFGGWDSVCGGALNSVRSIFRMISKVGFSFFFILAIIKSLRQW